MHPLEYLAIIFYIVAVIRCFSYGVYVLRDGGGRAFALSIALIVISGLLFFRYIQLSI